MRIGETLGLTSGNIDLEQNKIYIETTITKNKANRFVRGDTTKTPTGTRSIPLTPILRDILEPLVNKDNPEALIFSNNGKPHNESNINRVMKQVCTNAGIRVIITKKKKANGRISNLKTSDISVHRIKTSLRLNRSVSKSRPKSITSIVTDIKTSRLL